MMKKNNHINSLDMQAIITGQLAEKKSAALITHLGECDACLDKMDQLWAAQSGNNSAIDFPDMTVEHAQQLEQNFLHRMHHGNLSNKVVHFGTVGFLQVLLALLAPWFATRHKNEWRKS